jgi:Tfp pilus assembly protein FimT
MTTCTHPPSTVRESGFSLLEILVIVAIFGLILTMGMPMLNGIRLGAQVTAAQRDVAAAVTQARWMAINGGTTRVVDFSSSSSVTVETAGGSVLKTVSLNTYSVTQTNNNATITFDSRGMLSGTPTLPVTVTVANTLGMSREIRIDRLGKVQTP